MFQHDSTVQDNHEDQQRLWFQDSLLDAIELVRNHNMHPSHLSVVTNLLLEAVPENVQIISPDTIHVRIIYNK